MDVEEDLETLMEETTPKNTKQSTAWGTKVFDEYCQRNDIDVDFHTVSEDDFATILKRFYANIRKKMESCILPVL